MKRSICFVLAAYSGISCALAQQRGNDVTVPLHALQPDYVIPYSVPTESNIKNVLDRIFHYLDSTTPPVFINRVTKATLSNVADPIQTCFEAG